MRMGFSLPQYGDMATPGNVKFFARTLESAGAESFWVGDRALCPAMPARGFGGTPPRPFPSQFRKVLDPFAVLATAATCTERAHIGTSVLNATWYSPLLLARSLTTIDLLSHGRLIPGFGSGWSPDEFAALGIPTSGLGARLDEALDILDAVWSEGITSHSGALWTVPPSHFDLVPARRSGPPIYLGGFSQTALTRVGRRADGWLPTIRLPDRTRVDELCGMLATIRCAAERTGRDADAIDVVLRVDASPGTTPSLIIDTLKEVEQLTGINHAFVELLLLAQDVTEAIDIATTLLYLANEGAHAR